MSHSIKPRTHYNGAPFQVQAYRAGRWNIISHHNSATRGQVGLAKIRKCQPSSPHLYRMVHSSDDNYIWIEPTND